MLHEILVAAFYHIKPVRTTQVRIPIVSKFWRAAMEESSLATYIYQRDPVEGGGRFFGIPRVKLHRTWHEHMYEMNASTFLTAEWKSEAVEAIVRLEGAPRFKVPIEKRGAAYCLSFDIELNKTLIQEEIGRIVSWSTSDLTFMDIKIEGFDEREYLTTVLHKGQYTSSFSCFEHFQSFTIWFTVLGAKTTSQGMMLNAIKCGGTCTCQISNGILNFDNGRVDRDVKGGFDSIDNVFDMKPVEAIKMSPSDTTLVAMQRRRPQRSRVKPFRFISIAINGLISNVRIGKRSLKEKCRLKKEMDKMDEPAISLQQPRKRVL